MNEDNPTPRCPRCGAAVTADAPDGLCPRCLLALNLSTQTDVTGDETDADGSPPVKPPPPPAPAPEEIAKLFPHLEVLGLLGQGGMGAVYKARQPKLDRFVALKVLLRRRADGTTDPAFSERFAREARALARLNHPAIVAVYEYGEAGGYPFLLMEYVEGLTLRQLLVRGKLAAEEALAIVPKICEALQFAHQRGIVHRDIKPENILLDTEGQVKIADFGIAKILAPGAPELSLTNSQGVVGTPHYMAPEQVEHPTHVDHRADIFSLGVVFYEMLTGELPLGKFAPPSRKVHVDVRLDEVVLHALEKEPERRYQQASQVKTDVETIAATQAQAPGNQKPLSSTTEQGLVRGPAIGLLVTGILNWVLIPLVVMGLRWFAPVEWNDAEVALSNWGLVALGITSLGLCSFLIYAALKMMRLEGYRTAVAASVTAMLVTPGNIVGLPLGIWALVTLARPEVKAAFRKSPGVPGDLPAWGALAALGLLIVGFVQVGAPLLGRRVSDAAEVGSPAFGTVLEFTLTDMDDLRGGEALDLDQGRLLDLPKDLDQRPQADGLRWLEENGADLLLDQVGGRWGLLTATDRELKLGVLPAGQWETPNLQTLSNVLATPTGELEVLQRGPWTAYVLSTDAEPPLTFAFRTDGGASGQIEITRFGQQPNSARIRYRRLLPREGGPSSPSVATTRASARRTFVRLVVDQTALTFEGRPTTWETLDALLAVVPDRTNTVLEVAVTTDQLTVAQQNQWFQKASALARQHGFEYASFIGIHPLGSQGTPATTTKPGMPPAQTSPTGFGPVWERVLHDPDERPGEETLTLATGALSSELAGVEKLSGGRIRALVASGSDLFAEFDDWVSGRWALVTAGVQFGDLLPQQWDSATVLDVQRALTTPTAVPHLEAHGATLYLLPEGLLPMTFGFRTRQGSTGLLQITGFTDNPRGLKLRYRLGTQVRLPP